MPTLTDEDVRAVIEDVLPAMLRETIASRTPTAQIDTELIRALARDEAQKVGNEAQMECEFEGPICKVQKELDTMNLRLTTIETEAARESGAREAMAKLAEASAKKIERYGKIAALVVSLLTAANIAISLLRLAHR